MWAGGKPSPRADVGRGRAQSRPSTAAGRVPICADAAVIRSDHSCADANVARTGYSTKSRATACRSVRDAAIPGHGGALPTAAAAAAAVAAHPRRDHRPQPDRRSAPADHQRVGPRQLEAFRPYMAASMHCVYTYTRYMPTRYCKYVYTCVRAPAVVRACKRQHPGVRDIRPSTPRALLDACARLRYGAKGPRRRGAPVRDRPTRFAPACRPNPPRAAQPNHAEREGCG